MTFCTEPGIGLYAMSEDVVNKPEHYRKEGFEVIDVIEAYELPYHLGNVVKYILRHQYKGHAVQDLRKAQWYLNRYLDGLEDEADARIVEERRYENTYTLEECLYYLEGWDLAKDDGFPDVWPEDRDCAKAFIDGYVEAVKDGQPYPTDEELHEAIEKKDELYQSFVHTPSDRIPGDDEAAQQIKSSYYRYDRFDIHGYCAYCDAELSVTKPYVSTQGDPRLFCRQKCRDLQQELEHRSVE